MAKTITINGKKLKLAFSMGAAVNYERLTGQSALDLAKFTDGKHIAPVAELGYCMLVASNKEGDVPEFKDFMASLDTLPKMQKFTETFSEALNEFFKEDKTAKNTEDAAKNA